MNMKSDLQIQQEVQRELRWDTRVGGTDLGVSVDEGVVTLTGKVKSYARKMAAQRAAHRVAGVLDVANDVEVEDPDEKARTDTGIAQAVRRALEWDALVSDENIHSTVSDGWVTLEGGVKYLREREDAERAVWGLEGVRGVYNNIRVIPPKAEQKEARGAIEEALERRAAREAERINVELKDGTVRLAGRVHSWEEKQAILRAVSHSAGVHAIDDQLRIDPYF